MTQTLTANTARANLSTALVAGLSQPFTPRAFPRIAAGETFDVELYLIENGAYDTRSGATGYTPRIKITLDDMTPQDGTFTISDGVTNYTVSGAGTTAANGLYLLSSETFDSHSVWAQKDGTHYIRRETHNENHAWHIVQADSATQATANAYLYNDGQNGAGPDLTGWSVDVDGTAAAPTLAVSIATTTALDYDALASEVEAALNALNDNTGPFCDSVLVDKFGNGAFSIVFDSVGNKSPLVADVAGIRPASSATVSAIVDGSASRREEQIIKVSADPLVSVAAGVEITNGWTVSIDATGENFLRAVTVAQGAISANYSIELVADSGAVDVVARGPVILTPGA
jgi:hypothetical protein